MGGIPTCQPLLYARGGRFRRHGAQHHGLRYLRELDGERGLPPGEELRPQTQGGITGIAPAHHGASHRILELEEVVGEGEEARHRVGEALGEVGARHPLHQLQGRLLVGAGSIDADPHVSVIGEVAGVSLPRDGRWEGAEIDFAGKLGQGPRACHYHGRLAGCKGIHRLGFGGIGRVFAYVGSPARQLAKRRHIRGIGGPCLTIDQRQAAIFPMPVVGADILVAKLGDHPAVVGRQRQRQVAAILLHLLQHGKEVSTGSGRRQPQGVEDVDIEVKTLDHGSDGQAEGLGPGVGLPGRLGKAREVLHAGQVRQIQQIPLLEQP